MDASNHKILWFTSTDTKILNIDWRRGLQISELHKSNGLMVAAPQCALSLCSELALTTSEILVLL